MVHKYKYDNIYYGDNPYSYSETEAPVLQVELFSQNENIRDTKGLIFCLDTGADNKASIPDHILDELGILIGETTVAGYDGVIKTDQPLYSIGVRIDDLELNEIVPAVGTKNRFGLLPRTIINKWAIFLDAPNKEFTITS